MVILKQGGREQSIVSGAFPLMKMRFFSFVSKNNSVLTVSRLRFMAQQIIDGIPLQMVNFGDTPDACK